MRVFNRLFVRASVKALSLLEIIIALSVVAILAVVGLYVARDFVEASKARVCEANLKVLKNALDLYMLDHDRMPQTLGRIPDRYIQKSLARFLSQPGNWQARLYYWASAREKQSQAYAASHFINDLAQADIGIATCPKDTTPPPDGISYGLYQGLQGISARAYMEINATQVLIGDDDGVTFDGAAGLTKRHYRYGARRKFSQGIRKDNVIVKTESGM